MENNKCKNCGATYKFDPATCTLKCVKCGSEILLPTDSSFRMHDIDMKAPILDDGYMSGPVHLKCMNCGSEFESTESSIAVTCAYCGSNVVQNLDVDKRKPDGVIPFGFSVEDAKTKFFDGLKKKSFLPNKFKNGNVNLEVDSIYVPAFKFTCKTVNNYNGKIYEDYEDSEKNKHREYRHISGTLSTTTDNILIECSEFLDQKTLNAIRPFNLNQCYKYDEGFIMGYSVEFYNRKMAEIRDIAVKHVERDVRSKILSRYHYDGVSYLDIDTTYESSGYAHLILPTYRVKYKYGKKSYYTFMNGQTGKVGRNLPRSGVKILFFVLGILGIIGAIVGAIVAAAVKNSL